MELGTIAAIHVYPVKSLRSDTPDEVLVTPSGLEGDRSSALMVRDGHAREGKTYRGKENDRLHLVSDADAGAELASERGVRVDLERSETRFFDDAPVSLIVDRWLGGLNAHLGMKVEYERFRPNFYVRSVPGFAITEEDMTGRELKLGEIALRVRYPIERCVVTTYDPSGGPSEPEILKYLASHRSNWMGIYCDVLRAGTVRIGDSLALVER